MNSKQNKQVLIAVLFALIFSAVFLFLKGAKTNQVPSPIKTNNSGCVSRTEEKTVRGRSLSGLIEPGSTVRILFGYYNCNEIRRGDVVAYNFSGDKNPIIKIAKGIPGDKFHLQETAGAWNILINGETLKNSQSEPYLLGEGGYRMLSLYERDYKGVIPANTYMILGNLVSGSLDSARFGLVGKGDILGKIDY